MGQWKKLTSLGSNRGGPRGIRNSKLFPCSQPSRIFWTRWQMLARTGIPFQVALTLHTMSNGWHCIAQTTASAALNGNIRKQRLFHQCSAAHPSVHGQRHCPGVGANSLDCSTHIAIILLSETRKSRRSGGSMELCLADGTASVQLSLSTTLGTQAKVPGYLDQSRHAGFLEYAQFASCGLWSPIYRHPTRTCRQHMLRYPRQALPRPTVALHGRPQSLRMRQKLLKKSDASKRQSRTAI